MDLKALPLSPLQGYLASRLDGHSDVAALAQVTGMPAERVQALMGDLVAMGAVDAEAGAAAAPPSSASAPPEPKSDPGLPNESAGNAAPPPSATGEAGAEAEAAEAEPGDHAGEEGAEPEPSEEATQTHRQLFQTKFHPIDKNERVALAPTAEEPELSALCFDPVGEVIVALLTNMRFGPTHARLVARHHHNSLGLEKLCSHAPFAADAGVRRALLQNPQLTAGLYRRLWQNRRLLDQFKVATSREVTEMTRRSAREVMRARFTTAVADERVELIIKTEGRCLQMLIGLPVDSKTTSILCARTYASTTLVQNLARWTPAPPALIAHLLKQDLVRRSPTLRTLLMRHPNAPRAEH